MTVVEFIAEAEKLGNAETALRDIIEHCHASGDLMTLYAVTRANRYFAEKGE